jgi:Bax protein
MPARWMPAAPLALLLIGLEVAAQGVDSQGRPVEHFEYDSYTQLASLAERLNYTQEAWMAGIREVPRVFLTNVPPRWRDSVSSEVTVQTKKQLFFRIAAPLALRANEFIMRDRVRAESQRDLLDSDADFTAWINGIALRYGITESEGDDLAPESYDELLMRLDIVPVSLALAQAAEESGWGTSRFAAEGNALFGQWSWDDSAIKPLAQRGGMGNYGIAAFETPLESVRAYMHNLNTHQAYAELRERRAELRRESETISGWELANTLTRYSERGAAYVDTLHTIMRVNRLADADDAYLSDGPTIFLMPVGAGAE